MIGTKIANKNLWWKRPVAVKRAKNNAASTSTQKNIDTGTEENDSVNFTFNNLKGKGGG